MSTNYLPVFLSPAEAADCLGISRSKIYEMLAGGELRSTKIGGLVRIPRHWFEEYVAEHMGKAGVEWSDDLPEREAPTSEKTAGGSPPSRLRLVSESPATTRPAKRRSKASPPSKQSTRLGDW